MPRPKSYDRADAIERACYAFWEKGYRALGVRALQEAAGLNAFAIRTEFGGKEGLYLAALELYASEAEREAMAPMKGGGLDTIIEFFENLVTEASPTSSQWGCLMVNTGIENADIGSQKLASRVQRYWESLAAHFRQALLHAAEVGDLRDTVNIDALAEGLVTAAMGIHSKNRSAGAHDAGRPMVDILRDYLESLRTS